MNKIRITKHFDFESAHALYGYDGKCKNIHGHSYHIYVTVIGTPIEDDKNPKNGMVMDFGDLKVIIKREIVEKFDHAVVLNENSPHRELANTINEYSHKVVLVPYQPTSENMLMDFAERIQSQLPQNVLLHSLKLYETANSYAEWFASDQK
ncbi:6-pyruvoyl trahydropterin synthase family protein [Lutimonas sp.]|jgi:6-pyruvoyltetrahydropterin/6-carboxytetrahydropterin synthase|uniref:6-pyruvoyl trahydropterin synthase family protein n=1 Tax=Lutimonas sp. TaxID=1872403 RepID=UPI003C7276D7